jgi:hypothetical protein
MPVPGIHFEEDEEDEYTADDALTPLQLAAWQGETATVSTL